MLIYVYKWLHVCIFCWYEYGYVFMYVYVSMHLLICMYIWILINIVYHMSVDCSYTCDYICTHMFNYATVVSLPTNRSYHTQTYAWNTNLCNAANLLFDINIRNALRTQIQPANSPTGKTRINPKPFPLVSRWISWPRA